MGSCVVGQSSQDLNRQSGQDLNQMLQSEVPALLLVAYSSARQRWTLLSSYIYMTVPCEFSIMSSTGPLLMDTGVVSSLYYSW